MKQFGIHEIPKRSGTSWIHALGTQNSKLSNNFAIIAGSVDSLECIIHVYGELKSQYYLNIKTHI